MDVFPHWIGKTDILIGSNYCGLHPYWVVATAGKHLKVLEVPFGGCVHGFNSRLKQDHSAEPQFIVHTGVDEVV